MNTTRSILAGLALAASAAGASLPAFAARVDEGLPPNIAAAQQQLPADAQRVRATADASSGAAVDLKATKAEKSASEAAPAAKSTSRAARRASSAASIGIEMWPSTPYYGG